MSAQYNAILTRSIIANGPLIARRFIGLDYALPSIVGAGVLGVALTDAADGELCPAVLIGTAPVEMGGDVVTGQVMTDAEGRAILWQPGGPTDNFAAGVALMRRGVLGPLGSVHEVLIRPDRN